MSAEEQQPLVDVASSSFAAAAPSDEKTQQQAREQREAEYQEQVRQETYRAKVAQARAPVSPWKRAALLLFVCALFWLAFRMRAAPPRRNPVVHADRYSKQFKYRPAASPIVTSRLPDGRTRIRGADVDRLRAKEAAAAAAERKNPTTKQSKAAAAAQQNQNQNKNKKKTPV